MGKSASTHQISGLIRKILKGESADLEQLRSLPLEQLIEQFNIYHQELEFQNNELVQARFEAERSEARFRDLFRNAPFGYVIFDEGMRITKSNRACAQLFGAEEQQLENRKITEFIEERVQDDFYFTLRRLKSEVAVSEESLQFRIQNEHQERIISARIQYLKAVEESAAGLAESSEYRMLLIDVTEQKKQEERLTSLLNNLPVGVVAADRVHRTIAFCNQTMCDMLGRVGAELIGQNLLHFHPEKEQARASAEYDKGSALDVTLKRPFALMHASGRVIYVTVSAVELDLFGSTYWCGVYSEVTAQLDNLHKKNMFQDIVDNTSDIIGTATLNGKVIYVNHTFHTRLGYDIAKEVIGENIFSFHPSWVQQLFREKALDTLMKTGRWEGETAIHAKDGTEIPVSQLMIRHDKPDGSIDYISTSMRDISERNEIDRLQAQQQQEKEAAAAQLRKEQKKMELILSQAPDGVISVDGELRIQFANKKAQGLFDIAPDEVTGINITEIIPQLGQLIQGKAFQALKNLQGHDLPLQDRQGNSFWGQISVSVVDFEDELYYTFFIRDVTERKQNEELLIQNTRRLNEIALNSRTIAWELDAQGVYTFISPVCETMLGYRVSEIVGIKSVFDFHPEAGRAEFKKEVRGAFLRGQRFSSFYNKMQTRDGRIIWVATNGLPVFDADGNLKGYRGSDTDVTELMEAEQRNRLLQKAVESSTVGIVLADMRKEDQPIMYVNPAFEQITGYHPDEVTGTNCRFLQADDRMQPELEIIRKAIREGSSCRVTLRNYRKDGKLFWNQLALSPIFDDNNILTHFIGVQHDVTRLKEAETSLIRQSALQSFLLSVSARFVNVIPADVDRVVNEILGESADMLHVDCLSCGLYTPDRRKIVQAWAGDVSAARSKSKVSEKPAAQTWPVSLFADHQTKPLYIHDARALPGDHPLKKWLLSRGVRGYALMPMTYNSTCTGFLATETYDEPLVLGREQRGMIAILIQLLVNLQNRIEALGKVTQSEEKFAMAFQSSPYAIAITDPHSGRFIEVNNAFYQYTGYTPEDVRESRVTSLNIWADKEERAIMKEALERGDTVDNLEFTFRKKNGEIFRALLSSRVIHIDGKPFFITSINDISERILAQQKLAESEEKYRLLFAANKDAITIYTLDTAEPEIVETNAAASDLTGYTLEELRNRKITDIETELTPEQISMRSEYLYNHAEVNYETRIRTKAGAIKEIEVKSVLIFYEDRPSFMTISRDITQRKKDERKLREMIQRNSAMLAGIPDMMFMFNREKQIIDFSTGDTSKLLDTTAGFVGENLDTVMPPVVALEAGQKIDEVLTTGKANSYTYALMMNNGKRYFEARFVACGSDQVMAIVRDVTDAKEAEREILRFSRIFESSINEIYLFSPGDYRFQVMNPAARRNLGYTDEEVSGLDAMQVSGVTPDQLDEALKPLLAGEKEIVIMEARHRRKDGSTYDVQSYIQLITYEDEQLFAGIVVDITERLNYLRYLEDQNKVLRDISWSQSHLVRAPLARMMSLIMLLQEKDFETFSESEILEHLSKSASEIDEMIYDIAQKTESTVFKHSGE